MIIPLLEDPRKRLNIAYYNSFERMEARLRNHVTAMPKIINDNLVQVDAYFVVKITFFSFLLLLFFQVQLPAKEGRMNQPIQIGFSVLERR